MPEILGGVSIVIAVTAYAVYLHDTFTKGVRPHILTWLAFGGFTAVGCHVQFKKGAGPGAWTLGVTALSCVVIAAASARKQSQENPKKWKDFSWKDWIWFLIAVVGAIIYHLVPNRLNWAAICATAADIAAYVPTLRQAWRDPDLECRKAYFLNSVKFIPTLWALRLLHVVSIPTALYPFAVLAMNMFMVVLLTYRRSVLKIAEGVRREKAHARGASRPM